MTIRVFFNGYGNDPFSLWASDGTAAGTNELFSSSPYGLNPSGFTAFLGGVVFQGTNSQAYQGLWLTDGTPAGTREVPVQGAFPTGPGLQPTNFAVLGDKALFSGLDANSSMGLWVTDGTTAGTTELLSTAGDLQPANLTTLNNVVLFSGIDDTGHMNLWSSDGTAAGTAELSVAGAWQGTDTLHGGLFPGSLAVLGDNVFFAGDDNSIPDTTSPHRGLWVTDGTANGTTELSVASANADGVFGVGGYGPISPDLTPFDGKILFEGLDDAPVAHVGLWTTDGTAQGTAELTVAGAYQYGIFFNGAGNFSPDFTVLGDKVIFEGLNTAGNRGLWVTDGTSAGTRELVPADTPDSFDHPSLFANGILPFFAAVGGKVLFEAYTATSSGPVLWETDGTSAGTQPLNVTGLGATPQSMTAVDIPSRTLSWTGTSSAPLASPANWSDLTNNLGTAQAAPNLVDTVRFDTNSGAITGNAIVGTIQVGSNGSGVLQLDNATTLIASAFDAGAAAGAVGQIGLAGTGTDLTVTGDATVGDDGTGVLSVLSGATFSAASLTIGSLADSSGAVVVSGLGSVIDLTGGLNVGTSLGTGDLTVGPSAAVHASVVNLQGQVVLEGGLLDPTVNLINQGQTAGGFGTIAANFIVDEGVLQAGGTKLAQRLLIVQGTVLGGGGLTKNNAAVPSVAAGVLQINAGGTMELTGAVLNAATTTFTDNLTPTGTYAVANSVIDVTFADAAGVLLLDDIAQFDGTIASFAAGDSFVITGGTLSNVGVSNGNTLTFSDSGTGARAGGIDQIVFGSAVNAGQFAILNSNTLGAVKCFAVGTRIATSDGPTRVEELVVGDRVMTADGRMEPIVWIGQRAVDCARHPDPRAVWPVRVAAGAFGPNVPRRDLYLSPDHAVFVDDALVPIKLLINGRGIVQVRRAAVVYYHVELGRHEVILAEDLAVESYLDVDNHTSFHRVRGTIRLFPDFAARLTPDAAWEARGAAPLLLAGSRLRHTRRALDQGLPIARRTEARHSFTAAGR